MRKADVVVALSAIERRSAWEVLNDLSGPPGDIFRLRVIAPDATLGNLPLEQGIRLLQDGTCSWRRRTGSPPATSPPPPEGAQGRA